MAQSSGSDSQTPDYGKDDYCKEKIQRVFHIGTKCKPGCIKNNDDTCIVSNEVTGTCKNYNSDECNKNKKICRMGKDGICTNIAYNPPNKDIGTIGSDHFTGGKLTHVSNLVIQQQSKYKKTTERVRIQNKARVVYTGPRGGKYIKNNGAFVSLKKSQNTNS